MPITRITALTPKQKQLIRLILLNKHFLEVDDFWNLGLRQLLVNFDFNIFDGILPEEPSEKI